MCGLLVLMALSSPARAEWQNFRGARDGLADNQVFDVAEDPQGRLWFGTLRGASRFDGARWLTERDSLVPTGVGSPSVHALLMDRRGRLWFGTPLGLACFDGVRWTRYSAADRLPVDAVSALLEDHRGEIWIGTAGGLVRHDPATNQWQTITESPNGLIYSWAWRMIEDRQHRLWIATPRGVSCLDSTRTLWSRYSEDPAGLARDSVLAIAEDNEGAIWFGTDLGAFRLRDGAWTHFTTDSGLVSPAVLNIRASRSGPVWFGGFAGLTRFDGWAWRPYPRTADGQLLGLIRSLYEDSVGNLWVGTASAGLYRFDGVEWRNYFAPTSKCTGRLAQSAPFQFTLSSNCLTDLLQDRSHDMWFATAEAGVNRYDRRGRWSILRRTSGRPLSDSIHVMLEDRAGNLWFGAEAAGLTRADLSRSQWDLFTRTEGMAGDTVFAVTQDRRGDVWAGTATGVGRWNGSTWFRDLTGTGTVAEGIHVQGIVEDEQERVWLRTSEGLYRIPADRSAAQQVTTAEGLLSDAVTTMRLARDGRLWVGTVSGLSVFDGVRWTSYTDFGLSDTQVNSLLEDRQGRLWVATNFGVAYRTAAGWTAYPALLLGGSPLDATEQGLFEDDRGSIWVPTFAGAARFNGEVWRTLDNRGDGLAQDQITRMFEDAQGHIWMLSNGSFGGLTEHEPDRVAPQTIFISGPAALTPSQDADIVFGAAYGEAADVEFSTSWDGGPFSLWSPTMTWSMSGIPDGPHELVVRSREWLRNQDPTEARYPFEVDATAPAAIISEPAFGQAVRGALEIRGVAADPRFRRYRVDARPLGSGDWTGAGVVTLDSSLVPVPDGRLAGWDTVQVPDGFYELRLAVADTLGLVGSAYVTVLVDNHAPFAEVTAPRTVSSIEGGDVYSTLGEVHFYFPPRAFAEDARVTVARGDVLSTAGGDPPLAPNQTWMVAWDKPLLKSVTVEMATAGIAETLSPAIFRERAPSDWERIGGTLDPSRGLVSAAITQPGRYALLPDASPPSGGNGGLSALGIVPRVLSHSAGSARRLGISFTLARSAPTTISVYNRAGRRIRELAQGAILSAGANLIYWDGLDQSGRPVEDGVYLVGVEALGDVLQKQVGVVR